MKPIPTSGYCDAPHDKWRFTLDYMTDYYVNVNGQTYRVGSGTVWCGNDKVETNWFFFFDGQHHWRIDDFGITIDDLREGDAVQIEEPGPYEPPVVPRPKVVPEGGLRPGGLVEAGDKNGFSIAQMPAVETIAVVGMIGYMIYQAVKGK